MNLTDGIIHFFKSVNIDIVIIQVTINSLGIKPRSENLISWPRIHIVKSFKCDVDYSRLI